MIDDGDFPRIPVLKNQIGNSDEAIAADIKFKLILDGQNSILIAKTIEGIEILKTFLML